MSVPLTVIIPAYNEAPTIGALLDRVAAAPYPKQIIVVDDGSRDETGVIVETWRAQRSSIPIQLISCSQNRGKGTAIRRGLERAKGQVILIQDADLEYEPADYPRLVEPILAGWADVVFGSRYLLKQNRLPWTPNRVCVHLLNVMVHVLYGQRITDEATCYKAFRRDVLQRMGLQCQRFEFCPEATAKTCRMGIPIHEVPIRYRPRTAAEGKKIGWRDGLEAIRCLLYWRFARFTPLPDLAKEQSLETECVSLVAGRAE